VATTHAEANIQKVIALLPTAVQITGSILNIVATAEGNSAPGAEPAAVTHVCCVPPLEQSPKCEQWALTRAGKPYDIFAVCGIAFDRDWTPADGSAPNSSPQPLKSLARLFSTPRQMSGASRAARPPPVDATRSDLRHIHPLLIEWPA